MRTKQKKKFLFLALFISGLIITSCDTISSDPQFFEDEESQPDETETIYFPLVAAETDFNAYTVSDIECSRFVMPDGDDNHPGTQQQPWGSFQGAADNAYPGDTVCFLGGTYQTEDIHISKSGKENDLITFAAYPGEIPILDGEGSAGELLVFDAGSTYVRVSGFRLQNFRIWGVLLSGNNHHIFLDHLDIEGGEASVRFTYAGSAEEPPEEGHVEYVILENSLIHGSQYSAVDCTPGPCNHMILRQLEVFNTGLIGDAFYGSDGIEFARGHDVLVEDCYVHDNGGDGIDLGSRDREGNIPGVIVRRNQVVRNHLNGIKVWAGGVIENNIVWGSGDSAIWSGSFDCDLSIINNTVAYNLWDTSYAGRNWAVAVGYPEEMARPEVNLTMVNNIFAFNADPLEGGPTGVYLGPGVNIVYEGHNIYFSNPEQEIMIDLGNGIGFSREAILGDAWATYAGGGDGNLTVDPLFISGWPDVDLYLQLGSPAIDAGAGTFAPGEDLERNPRGDPPDIGAYEE